MKSTLARHAAAFLTMTALAAGPLRAQTVVISEVRADAGGRWVELHNRGSAAVNLASWSLHYASRTPGTPQNYWWPFPTGTVLQPNGYLRVHWYQTASSAVATGELWTGTSPYGFLFGLGGETLLGTRGALALFSTQQNANMNTAAYVADWVSWGENGYTREGLAVQQGLWTAGRHLGALPAGSSHARDPGMVGAVAFPDLAWFLDNSPTPGLPNVTGAVVQSYGQACVLPGNHLLGMPSLTAPSLPLVGNSGFTLTVQNTTGIFAEFVLLGFSAGAAPPGAPSILPLYSGVPCQEAIDTQQLLATWVLPTQILGTHVPMSMANVPPAAVGLELHVQALVLQLLPNSFPPYQGISNALRLVVGQ